MIDNINQRELLPWELCGDFVLLFDNSPSFVRSRFWGRGGHHPPRKIRGGGNAVLRPKIMEEEKCRGNETDTAVCGRSEEESCSRDQQEDGKVERWDTCI